MKMKQRILQVLAVAAALAFGASMARASDFKLNYNFDVFVAGGGSTLFRGTDFRFRRAALSRRLRRGLQVCRRDWRAHRNIPEYRG